MAETAADLLISELLALGLLTALNGAFALALPIWVWLGVAALCAAWPALHRVPLSKAGRYGAALALAVGYLVLLFAVQQPLFGRCGTVRGCRQAVLEYTLQRKILWCPPRRFRRRWACLRC